MRIGKPRSAVAVAVWVAVCMAAAAPETRAQEEKFGNDICIECHAEENRPIDLKLLQGSVHGKLDCMDCHGGIKKIPHPKKLKPVMCGPCHGDANVAFRRSIHYELDKKGVSDTPNCKTCHGWHDVLPRTDIRSRTNHLKVDATCLKCHADMKITGRHPNMPPAEFVEKYGGTVHGRGVHFVGLTVAATCSDCHGHHDMRPKEDPTSSVNPANVPKTCSTCHRGIFEDWKDSTHGKLWGSGEKKGPVCTTCHSAHEIIDPTQRTFRVRTPEKCGGCHKEESATYRDTFHGKATSLGFVVAATCSDCHTAHRNLPKGDPQSTVNKSNLQKTCGGCHPQASASFVKYDPHLDPATKKSPWAHYVNKFMILLLAGTFSFFGVHTLLWIQRAIVAVIRKEVPPEAEEAKFVRRFTPLTIGLHVTVVISFIILVSTGVPLRYKDAAWAQWIVNFLGGIEVTRFFHRSCAVITFGYGAVHVLWLVWQVVVRRKTRLIMGPDSLSPRPKDLQDLLANVKWFLYAGRPPRFGRWTYFEKFDYFAVFWGIPVIGLSGLMLWFPGFFTGFLPGSFLNLAAIVHSEEALLAGGFIFSFHFFHNHLRPENFPMDTSIFTGLIPLERFRRERPEQYEELAKAGRLDEIVVGPPSRNALLVGRIFGGIALTVGLLVVVGVVWSYFTMV